MRFGYQQRADGQFVVLDFDDPDAPGRVVSTRDRAALLASVMWRRQVAAPLVAAADGQPLPPPDNGTEFWAIVAFQDVESDDGRLFRDLQIRDMPLPLWCQFSNLGGHDGALIVGRFDDMTLASDAMTVQGHGWYDGSDDAAKAIQQAREKTNYGISMDATSNDYPSWECMEYDEDTGFCTGRERTVYDGAVIVSATQVGTPAFAGAQVSLAGFPEFTPTRAEDAPAAPEGADMDWMSWFFFNSENVARSTPVAAAVQASGGVDTEAGLTVVEAPADCGCDDTSLTAAAISAPAEPPADWFTDPQLAGPTPMSVGDDGRIVGHVAVWDTCHVGFPDSCTVAPRSASSYAYFHTGVVRVDDGTDRPCGTLTVGTGHASLAADSRSTAAHYDDTGTAVADVRVGEDEHGIWMAGAVRPGLTDEQSRELRACAPSGDWRRIGGGLELVAVLGVNVPGFPTPRAALAASAAGDAPAPQALVAAGSQPLVESLAEPWRAELTALRATVTGLESALTPLLPLARARLRAGQTGR